MTNLEELKQNLIAEIERRVDDRILEKENAELLTKLIKNADSEKEARNIAMLGTTYKRTGFHFDKRLEKMSDEIQYLAKNEKLSFKTSNNAITHKLIIGDNYPALQNLLISYKNKIKVIYIDPPYGKDSMGEFAQTNYNNAITRDNLLSSLYPRLMLAKDLLSDDGVIFCSIDDKNQAYIKCLFDEIFGESNFVADVIWHKKDNASFLGGKIVNLTDHILLYQKSDNFEGTKDCEINADAHRELVTKPSKISEKVFNKNFTIIENRKFNGILKVGLYGSEQFGMEILEDVEIENGIPKNDIKIRGKFCWSQETIDNEIKKGGRIEIKSIKGMKPIFYKNFGDEIPFRPMRNLLSKKIEDGIATNNDAATEIKNIFNGIPVFEYSKPSKLISKLVNNIARNDKNSIILDFYAGSGTTGHAVLELNKSDGGNRQFILCTNNEITEMNPNGIAYDVTSKRLKRVMSGECYDGTKPTEWLKNNEPYGDNLEVLEIKVVPSVFNKEKNPFELIDETLYGKEKFETLSQKIKWVCENFENTQKIAEQAEE